MVLLYVVLYRQKGEEDLKGNMVAMVGQAAVWNKAGAGTKGGGHAGGGGECCMA